MLIKDNNRNFFRRDNEVDDEIFKFWKQELERELPSFWEDVSDDTPKFK